MGMPSTFTEVNSVCQTPASHFGTRRHLSVCWATFADWILNCAPSAYSSPKAGSERLNSIVALIGSLAETVASKRKVENPRIKLESVSSFNANLPFKGFFTSPQAQSPYRHDRDWSHSKTHRTRLAHLLESGSGTNCIYKG
jgi:hypothetical protein